MGREGIEPPTNDSGGHHHTTRQTPLGKGVKDWKICFHINWKLSFRESWKIYFFHKSEKKANQGKQIAERFKIFSLTVLQSFTDRNFALEHGDSLGNNVPSHEKHNELKKIPKKKVIHANRALFKIILNGICSSHGLSTGSNHLFLTNIGHITGSKESGYIRLGILIHDYLLFLIESHT